MRVSLLSAFVAGLSAVTASVLPRQVPGGGKLLATGVGVKDLAASTTFYKALGLAQIGSTFKGTLFSENTLNYPGVTSQQLILTKWADGRLPTAPVPVHLVFFSADPAGFAAKVTAAGGKISQAPAGATPGVGTDLDGYTIIIFPISAIGVPTTATNVFAATGLGYTGTAGFDFYTKTLGLVKRETRTYPGYTEEVLDFSLAGSPIATINFTDGVKRTLTGQPVKLRIALNNLAGVWAAYKAAGGVVVRELGPQEDSNGIVLAYGRDPSGYLLEFVDINAPPAPPA